MLNALPKTAQPEARSARHDIRLAATRQDAERALGQFIATYLVTEKTSNNRIRSPLIFIGMHLI